MASTRDDSTTTGLPAAPPPEGTGARLTFNAPMSEDRATALVAELARQRPRTVLDVGCGWAELLLRVVEAVPDAHGVGVDVHAPDIDRAARAAAERGVEHRVDLRCGQGDEGLEQADLVLSIGAYQAFGSVSDALTALRGLVRPGGRLLFAAECWTRPPTAEELAVMWEGACAQDCTDLAGLVEQAVAAGFRPTRVTTATTGEWEAFESGFLAEREEWLAAHPDHPDAATVRQSLDESWASWLRGRRDVLGFGYLTLLPTQRPRPEDMAPA